MKLTSRMVEEKGVFLSFKRKSRGSCYGDPLPEGRIIRGRVFVSLDTLDALVERENGDDWKPGVLGYLSDDQEYALEQAGLAWKGWNGYVGTEKLRTWMKKKGLMRGGS